MTAHTLYYDDTPPSFNAVGFTGNRWALTKAVKEWKELLGSLLLLEFQNGLPRGCNRVSARVDLEFPSRRRRDAENYRVIISKALGDALTTVGVIPDDTAEFFELAAVGIEAGDRSRTTIHLTCSAVRPTTG